MPPTVPNTNQVQRLILIASSTGGTRVIRHILQDVGILDAAIIITQHLALNADELFRMSLSRIAGMPAVLPKPMEAIRHGFIYVSPCDRHLLLDQHLRVNYDDGPQVNFVRPSADVMMTSIRPAFPVDILGIILTGIGHDGVEGMRHIKENNGRTVAQYPKTCTIKDMPYNAILTGCIDYVLHPDQIRLAVLHFIDVSSNAKQGAVSNPGLHLAEKHQ